MTIARFALLVTIYEIFANQIKCKSLILTKIKVKEKKRHACTHPRTHTHTAGDVRHVDIIPRDEIFKSYGYQWNGED